MKTKYTKKQILHEARNLLLVILGAAVLGAGTGIFIVPFDLVTGGVSGLAIVIQKLIPVDLSVDIYVAIITWTLFFIGLFTLLRFFAPILYSPVATLCFPGVRFSFAGLCGETDPDHQ